MRFPLGLFGGQESEQGLQESCLKQGDPQLVLRHDGSGRATGVIRFKPIGRDGSQHRVWKRQRNLEKWWQEADVEGSFTQSKATASTPRNALEFPVVGGAQLIESVSCVTPDSGLLWKVEPWHVLGRGLEVKEAPCVGPRCSVLFAWQW